MSKSTINLGIGTVLGFIIGLVIFLARPAPTSSVKFKQIVLKSGDLQSLHDSVPNGSGSFDNLYSKLHFYFSVDYTQTPAIITLAAAIVNSSGDEIVLKNNNPLSTSIDVKGIPAGYSMDASKFDLFVADNDNGDDAVLVNHQVHDLLGLKNIYKEIDQFELDPFYDATLKCFSYNIIPLKSDGVTPVSGIDTKRYARLLRIDPIPPGGRY